MIYGSLAFTGTEGGILPNPRRKAAGDSRNLLGTFCPFSSNVACTDNLVRGVKLAELLQVWMYPNQYRSSSTRADQSGAQQHHTVQTYGRSLNVTVPRCVHFGGVNRD
ncbi:hypothetical protein SELMODRAFT_425318 [Selaginella moellendorffii]|uniref:Uncharacterized protein n=1 Tax=Selaginella moellendorffii TaxID=88036 RepID=D8SSQ6_SELML|nr:hypothetical protein SELMODRAFT_425318 [Selaginella moellendorffii]